MWLPRSMRAPPPVNFLLNHHSGTGRGMSLSDLWRNGPDPMSVAYAICISPSSPFSILPLKACVDFGVKRFVYASSCAVYGNAEKLPIKEDFPTKPTSPYGLSKLVAEKHVCAFHEKFGLGNGLLTIFQYLWFKANP